MAAKKKKKSQPKTDAAKQRELARLQRAHDKRSAELKKNIETARSRMIFGKKSIGVSQKDIDAVSGKAGKKLLKKDK